MNLILLFSEDFIDKDHVKLTDRRCEHINKVHKATEGQRLTVGLINGNVGTGVILSINKDEIVLNVILENSPPLASPITLAVALPRPPMLKRILQTASTMGVKNMVFFHSNRVEKSFWQSPQLNKAKVEEELILGLEQAKDTVMPEVLWLNKFNAFAEDHLPTLVKQNNALVAHPYHATSCPSNITKSTLLVVGPEGGFVDYEMEKLNNAGCKSVHLGPRILRVETAVTVLLGRLLGL